MKYRSISFERLTKARHYNNIIAASTGMHNHRMTDIIAIFYQKRPQALACSKKANVKE
jgi:hypothetical protein